MSWADATLLAGYALTTSSVLLNVTVHDGDEVRAVGRVVNALVGPLTRPLRGPRRCDRHRRRCTCRDVRRSWRRGSPTAYLRVPPPVAGRFDLRRRSEEPPRSCVRAELGRDATRLIRDVERLTQDHDRAVTRPLGAV